MPSKSLASARPDWDTTWMYVAHDISRRSLCTRAKIGAVIVSKDNRVVATGYNGPAAGFLHGEAPCTHWCDRSRLGPTEQTMTSYEDCPSLHAELNALSVCDRSAREGGKIYITGAPCFSCAKAIANSGLTEVIVWNGDDAAYRLPERSYELLDSCGVTVVLV